MVIFMENNNRIRPFSIDKAKVYMIVTKTSKPSFHHKIKVWLWNFELHCIGVYRFGNYSSKLFKKNKFIGILPILLYFMLDYLSRIIHHVQIHRDAEIGPGFHLGHPSNIFIGATKIGRNCNVNHNVTIGHGLGSQRFVVPEFGDNIWIGPGVTITGDCKIGSGSAISAGTIVSKDIPENSLVVGNPGRIINNSYNTAPILGFDINEYIKDKLVRRK